MVTGERRPTRAVVRRARLRLVTLCVVEALALLALGAKGLAWHHWVLVTVAVVLTLGAWVVWGTRTDGWVVAAALTVVVKVATVVVAGLTGDAQLAPDAVVLGLSWALLLLVPAWIVSAVTRGVGV
ncbi:hypothetical protein [uncultured Tessaracoccus sp.]|uniref:hypothetical protein n=1 Tax=uncultured Tessaracoccus sp. TaxID=905023 RepID=UPI0025DAE237|nr:hypothetical protein [uncultured Tessaracoccus sp.]